MNRDVLGKRELESLKLNWNFVGPGLMNGRCNATGTCDNKPIPYRKKPQKPFRILQLAEALNAEEIRLQYGYLRF
jgi:hypothetical protein